ncbi:MAG: hypothetical protein WC238_05760 [Parcubacteria group bacterium]|jgi:hypothetical protein
MINDNFQRRKQDTLSKLDKSSKKSWDKKIISLCEKINKKIIITQLLLALEELL